MTADILYSSKREPCPLCNSSDGRATLTKYFDFDVSNGKYFKCFACDTFVRPTKKSNHKPKRKLSSAKSKVKFDDTIIKSLYEQSLFQHSDLTQYLIEEFEKYDAGGNIAYHIDLWRLTADNMRNQIFWYFDINDNLKTAKCIPYHKNGKRRKKDKALNLVTHTAEAIFGFQQDNQTTYFSAKNGYDNSHLYGEHQLNRKYTYFSAFDMTYHTNCSNYTIMLVESEKTAVIASFFMPNFLFLATGGANALTIDKLKYLRGRDIYIAFDNDTAGQDSALKISDELTKYKITHEILDISEYVGEKQDFADYYLNNLEISLEKCSKISLYDYYERYVFMHDDEEFLLHKPILDILKHKQTQDTT